ncbi:MAG: hypothetical protein ACREHD_32120 [Pirellulales bacterium]
MIAGFGRLMRDSLGGFPPAGPVAAREQIPVGGMTRRARRIAPPAGEDVRSISVPACAETPALGEESQLDAEDAQLAEHS